MSATDTRTGTVDQLAAAIARLTASVDRCLGPGESLRSRALELAERHAQEDLGCSLGEFMRRSAAGEMPDSIPAAKARLLLDAALEGFG